MKSIFDIINEKLTLNKQSRLISKNWSIKDAKDGDIITFEKDNSKYIFIFASLEKNLKYIQIYNPKDIFTYACYNVDDGDGWPTRYFDCAVLTIASLDKVSEEKFHLSTENEKQLLFNYLASHRLKWNPKKKEIIRN